MLLIIPIIAVCLLFIINFFRKNSIARALADTWIASVFFVWLTTEVLSAFKIWNAITVYFAWGMLLIILLLVFYKKKQVILLRQLMNKNGILILNWKPYWRCLLGFGIYFVIVCLLGILSSQYNVDSMVYHLPRIMHWIQNSSVGHFAPSIEFQVRYPCLSEYLVAQIYLAGVSDRLANLVQTAAYLASAVMVFGISRRIGVSKQVSFVGAGIYLMMPMAIAQAFSTQTDNIAGLFLLTFVFYILDFVQAKQLVMDKKGVESAVGLAMNVMLGYLCKPTICFVMLVFFVWMCVTRLIRKDKFLVLLKYVIVGGGIAVLLYMPLLYKSYQTYTKVDRMIAAESSLENEEQANLNVGMGNAVQAMTPDFSYNVQYALLSPKLFIITCIQNIARNSMSICFPRYNMKQEELIHKVGDMLEMDTSLYKILNDEQLFYQDTASNPCVMTLVALSLVLVLFRMSKTSKEQSSYVICAVLGMLLQCALMGFTLYRTRYLIGVMGVCCPAIAISIDRMPFKKMQKEIVLAIMIFSAAIGAINTYSYELPRIKESFQGESIHQYFLGNQDDEYVYAKMAEIIRNEDYHRVGIDGGLYMEYPLWQGVDNLQRLEIVNVEDIYFKQYEDMSFIPECVIKVVSEEKEVAEGDLLECHGRTYECMWAIHWYQVYFSIFKLKG